MLSKYEESLIELIDEVYAFGKLDKEALNLVHAALKEKSLDKAEEARRLLKNNHKANAKIDMNAITILALYAPEASDLRCVVSIIKIAAELSRIGDYIKTHAKNVREQIAGYEEPDEEDKENNVVSLIDDTKDSFYKSTAQALSLALEAIKETDSDRLNNLARKISVEESKCDDFVSILAQSMISKICSYPDHADDLVVMLHIMRKLERISDRSVNIVKLARYALEGGKLKL